MKPQTAFLFRSPTGKIESARGESAAQAAASLGHVLSWDGELNTLDLVRHGKTERWTFEGHREEVVRKRGAQTVALIRSLLKARST